jgi:uncharacterized LabA/DUF88 family protein
MSKYDYDVVQLVDAVPRQNDIHRHAKISPDEMAKNLSRLLKPLGPDSYKVAIVDDDQSYAAYVAAAYETRKIVGDKTTELMHLFQQTIKHPKASPPKQLVLVSEDPQLAAVCQTLLPETKIQIWANSVTAPRELRESHHHFQPLEELITDLKIVQIDVRIDLENIFIGLVNIGWRPNLSELVGAIRRALEKQCGGEVVATTGYADFDELNRHHGGSRKNWQRELTLAGAESRYVVSQHGKNTADMKIASDISTLVEHSSTAGVIDVIGLATMDRDFRHVVEKVKQRGKRVIIVSLKNGLSRELEAVAEVCYLDDYLTLPNVKDSDARPQHEDVTLMMKIAAWMHQHRWRRAYRDQLDQEFGRAAESLGKLMTDGWLVPTPDSPVDRQGRARALEFNPDNPSAQAAYYLARWIPERIHYSLKRMPYVDTRYLAIGMTGDRTLNGLGIAQSRVAAENWLNAAAKAGIVVANEQPHPQAPAKQITVWTLPTPNSDAANDPVVVDASDNTVVAASTAVVEDVVATEQVSAASATAGTEVPDAAVGAEGIQMITPESTSVSSSLLRRVLTHGLSDDELTTILFDHFRGVHRKFEGAPKVERIQALLDYVETRKQQDGLLAAIREINPILVAEPEAQLLAA